MPAVAQGAVRQPEVTVDLGVLDSLSGAGPATGRPVLLHPPRHEQEEKTKDESNRARKAEAKKGREPRSAKNKSEKSAESATRKAEAKRPSSAADHKREAAAKEHAGTAKPKIAEAAAQSPSPAAKKPATAAKPIAVPPTVTSSTNPQPAKSRAMTAAATPTAPPAARTQPAATKPAALENPRASVVAPLHVGFAAGTADLSPGARSELDSIAKSLTADQDRRLQLVAYATGSDDEANQARRLSLSRALNVRAYLIDHGVRNTRMDVRALGNRLDGGQAADRVDILFLEK